MYLGFLLFIRDRCCVLQEAVLDIRLKDCERIKQLKPGPEANTLACTTKIVHFCEKEINNSHLNTLRQIKLADC
jgi:hypothetical protein